MTATTTDVLVKPDMQAVLSRTHLAHDLHGFLLPVLEAISNAMDGIGARFGEEAKEKGQIHIHIRNPNDPAKLIVSVTDNGIGLTDENYLSFKTPFSGYKLHQRGRGFGRFIAFKVFSRILYSSRYEFFTDEKLRAFRFDIQQEQEFTFQDGGPEFAGTGLCVEYGQPLTNWWDLIRELQPNDIMEAIGSHFLPYFLYRWLPKITIQLDDDPPENITSHFKDVFVQIDSGQFQCEIDGADETLTYSLTRIPRSRQFKSHCLLLSAADRIVGYPRDLTNKLGQPHFLDENSRPYIVIAVVRGDAFERRLNDARTSINLSPKAIETIVSSVSDAIQAKEKGQIDKIKSEQSADLTGALRENPILRLGLRGRSLTDYVAAKPNHWKAEQFVSDLAIERFRATADLTKQITAAASSPADYERRIKDLVDKLDAGKKEALAEYVIHRKNIIALVESARKYQDDGKRAPEDDIHELVFRRFSDNVQTGYFEHNLWLIDDALSFLPYISSDRAMHGKGRKAGDKITDLVFFDDSMVLGDEDGSTLTIVEFKRPSRDDYRFGNVKTDPVLQVIETLEGAIAAGGITRTDGSHMSFAGVVRRFAFIVADLTPSLHKVLKGHDFKNDWNPKMYIRYRDNERIFIQALGYETLLEMAKKRNQAFFSVLLDE
ncbi:ATP-binding protein [Bosea sp. BK604]|uniref:ATP-binding protein n=1 Tax=Bosea sp. BK604 TaxID=2512180 RepID=UPI00105351CF|nr:ATP-binding protein [Bosea sp. BK604]TCR63044.1 histidine kinase/DNA gyrase B/HSP90-like ATPase [Bosea sp. BK604]